MGRVKSGRRGAWVAATALLALVSSGCSESTSVGTVGAKYVLVASSPKSGVAAAPTRGMPLAIAQPAPECRSDAEWRAELGSECEARESEGGASPDMNGTPAPGLAPTPGEVRWYCWGKATLRLVLQRCPGTNTFRVQELALAPRGAGR
jgi:hypothetical protein